MQIVALNAGASVLSGGGVGLLNRNQRAAARQLSLAAYLLFHGGKPKDENSIRESLPPYATIFDASLGEDQDLARATDGLRKQLARDVEALAGAGIKVEVEGDLDGRRYRLPPGGFSPIALDLTDEERAVLVGAVRTLRRDFPYAGPLRLALANLIGAASAGSSPGNGGGITEPDSAFSATVATRSDEEIARRVGRLENAVSRRKRVRFDYYSISRDETSPRKIEPYAISLLEGIWYLTGRDVGREDLRQFRLSRIRGRVTFATASAGGDFDLPRNFERRFAGPRAPWQLGEPDRTARIRLSREAVRGLRGPLRQAGTFERDEDGLVFVTRYSGERQLAGWILSLGEGVKVLSPESLVGRVKDGLEGLLAAHAQRSPKESR